MTAYHDFSLTHDVQLTAWRLDPERSSVEFEVPANWGRSTVRGRFHRYEGTLDLRREPAIELTIDATTIDTGNRRRDKHLRSKTFFHVEAHPQVVFLSDTATLEGERLTVTGGLSAANRSEPLHLVAALRRAGAELEIEATTTLDQRRLGMTYRLFGAIGTPATLTVRGRLVRA